MQQNLIQCGERLIRLSIVSSSFQGTAALNFPKDKNVFFLAAKNKRDIYKTMKTSAPITHLDGHDVNE